MARSFYLSDEEKAFVKRYIKDFPTWMRRRVQEELNKSADYCEEQIQLCREEITRWEALKEKAMKSEANSEKAVQELIEKCRERPDIDGFLTGASGRKLLKQTKLTKQEFKEILEVK